MKQKLKYTPFEKLWLHKPVSRIAYIADACLKKRVLDIGCYDETCLNLKKETPFWLHAEIAKRATMVVGIDSSQQLKKTPIQTGHNSIICKLNIFNINAQFKRKYPIDIIVAGELVEHIFDVSLFIQKLKSLYPNKILILSTPNATSLTNVLMALFSRESCHKDHVHVFSYKTLATVCKKCDVKAFEIIPYHVKLVEIMLRNSGIKRQMILLVEKIINLFEFLFPLLSGGYIVKIKL